jgi:gluconate 2-dehydrogenase gamma chain
MGMRELTEKQIQALNAICDRLVPMDASGPGALEAGAATYIELALESDYLSLLPLYQRGFRALDDRARECHGHEFARLDGRDQDSLLRELEHEPIESEGRVFFETVRSHVIEGMFGDPLWGGNRDYSGWRLIGYRRPRLTWTPADQAITPLPSRAPSSAPVEDQR